MRNVQAWLSARAENVAAMLLAALFGVFIVQIVSRYVFNHPVGWALEVCLTLWLWLVLWGGAFCLDDKDHVRFDILLEAARPRVRRLFALVSAIAIVAGLLAALPATYDYVSFYKIKKSATLRIRLDVVFSVYLIFAVAVIGRYAWRALAIMRAGSAGSGDGGNESSAS
ncbi:MAG: TRAP transporter small permease subunit [Hyphomicrobiaceae bacterium]|nr:TRAP transporter small permease subunit [Hyphomicrobiaceae bacterium]